MKGKTTINRLRKEIADLRKEIAKMEKDHLLKIEKMQERIDKLESLLARDEAYQELEKKNSELQGSFDFLVMRYEKLEQKKNFWKTTAKNAQWDLDDLEAKGHVPDPWLGFGSDNYY